MPDDTPATAWLAERQLLLDDVLAAIDAAIWAGDRAALVKAQLHRDELLRYRLGTPLPTRRAWSLTS